MTSAVGDLTRAVQEMTTEVKSLRRSTFWQWVTIALTGLGVITTAALVVITINVSNEQQQARDQQRIERTGALCPLYFVFLDSYDQQRRDALPPAAQKKYDDAFVTIRKGAEVFNCKR